MLCLCNLTLRIESNRLFSNECLNISFVVLKRSKNSILTKSRNSAVKFNTYHETHKPTLNVNSPHKCIFYLFDKIFSCGANKELHNRATLSSKYK